MTAGVLNTFRTLAAYVADKGATVAYIDGAFERDLILLVGMVLVDLGASVAYILAERRRGVVNVPAVVKTSERQPAPAAKWAG